MPKHGIPEDLGEMIRDIIAHRELERMNEEPKESDSLYVELPYFDHCKYENEETEWKIEIEL